MHPTSPPFEPALSTSSSALSCTTGSRFRR
jgi:hypothetical protein